MEKILNRSDPKEPNRSDPKEPKEPQGTAVDRHPFGGFKLSGIGTKAGGSDYLLEFLLTRSITENTSAGVSLRRRLNEAETLTAGGT